MASSSQAASNSGCEDKPSPKRKRRPAIPWDVMYQHLIAYKERFGHVKVTQKYVTDDGVKVRRHLCVMFDPIPRALL